MFKKLLILVLSLPTQISFAMDFSPQIIQKAQPLSFLPCFFAEGIPQQLLLLIEHLNHPGQRDFSRKHKNFLLIEGPSADDLALCVNYLTSLTQRTVLHCNAQDLQQPQSLDALFKQKAPDRTVLVIQAIEKLHSTSHDIHQDSQQEAHLRSLLDTELANSHLFVIGTTTQITQLNPALIQRADRIEILSPTNTQKRYIIDQLLAALNIGYYIGLNGRSVSDAIRIKIIETLQHASRTEIANYMQSILQTVPQYTTVDLITAIGQLHSPLELHILKKLQLFRFNQRTGAFIARSTRTARTSRTTQKQFLFTILTLYALTRSSASEAS